MTRILVHSDCDEDYENIESELDSYGMDYDYDYDGCMIVDDSEADIATNIIKDCGVDCSAVV